MSTAILTSTNLDIATEVLIASVLYTVQNANYVTVSMTEAQLLVVASEATPPRTDWNTDDVCTICSTQMGLTVTPATTASTPIANTTA